jgi:undecaprenyl-diphosphatase
MSTKLCVRGALSHEVAAARRRHILLEFGPRFLHDNLPLGKERDMNWLEAIFLSLLQGATEFLPVSSSGHEVIAQALLYGDEGHEEPVLYTLLVHVGTLISILWVFHKSLWELLRYGLVDIWSEARRTGWINAVNRNPKGRMIACIVLACVPTAIIGFVFKDRLEALFTNPQAVGYALCFTAVLLGSTYFRKPKALDAQVADSPVPPFDLPYWKALVVGVIQGMALIPGISRSGSTIAVALLLGMNRRLAGEFSFLIAVPAIFGAMLLMAKDFDPATSNITPGIGLLSLIVAALSGYVFLRLLLRFVRGGQFSWFALYCLAVGVWAIFYF